MTVSKISLALKEWLHHNGLWKARGTDALLVDGNFLKSEYDPRPGDRIYHYTSAEAADSIISTGKLWFSESQKMNDRSEYHFGRENFEEAVERFRGGFSSESIELYHRSLERQTEMEMMICSFSKERDDLNQWDRYADSASGIVLGFNPYWFVKNPGVRMKSCVYEMEYLEQLVEANLWTLDNAKKILKVSNPLPMDHLAHLFVCDQYCFKDSRFSSEQEVRLMRSVQVDERSKTGLVDGAAFSMFNIKQRPPLVRPFEMKVRKGQYGETRFIELPFVHKSWSALRSIGFGPRCTKTTEDHFRNKYAKLKYTNFWRSDLPLR